MRCVADGETKKKKKKIAKVFALTRKKNGRKLYRVESFRTHLTLAHRVRASRKKYKKEKRNLCKLMKIYLSAHENHLMFPAVNIYSKKRRVSERRDKRTFLPKNSLKFCIFTFSTIFRCTHKREKFLKEEIFFNCFSNG